MRESVYQKIVNICMDAHAQERSIDYLVEHLRNFIYPKERVLICFLEHEKGSLGWLMEQAVLQCNATPVLWTPDRRWNTLLRQAFHSRATVVIGPPLVVLGLSKLQKHRNIPLNIRKVITAGYPCLDWMIEGIVKGLDCEAGGCFSLNETGVVAGFACGHSWGIHLRQDEYGVDIVDDEGNVLPEGELGEIILYPKSDPSVRFPMGEYARLVTEPCACGSPSPRLIDLTPGKYSDPDLLKLGQFFQSWTSILDCRMKKGESGLEIEIVCFPGEKLPKLPTAAKLIVRPWNPKNDEPFYYLPSVKTREHAEKD